MENERENEKDGDVEDEQDFNEMDFEPEEELVAAN